MSKKIDIFFTLILISELFSEFYGIKEAVYFLKPFLTIIL